MSIPAFPPMHSNPTGGQSIEARIATAFRMLLTIILCALNPCKHTCLDVKPAGWLALITALEMPCPAPRFSDTQPSNALTL